MKKVIIIISSILVIISTLQSCKKCGEPGEDPCPCPACPIVTALVPEEGKAGEEIMILGTNFGGFILAEDKVTINGKEALVLGIEEEKLTVQVPPKAGTGPVIVKIGELSSDDSAIKNGPQASPPIFTYQLTITVSTFAGIPGNYGYVDGDALLAKFYSPTGVAVDAFGNVFVAELSNHRIRKITPSGMVSTLAGSGERGLMDGSNLTAQFSHPSSLCLDAFGNIYTTDQTSHLIRKITPSGEVSTLAGNGELGFVDGSGGSAKFYSPTGIVVGEDENIYVMDKFNHAIRRITPAGLVSSIAGSGNFGYREGAGAEAEFNSPHGIAIDHEGNLIVSDMGNHIIRSVKDNAQVTTIAGSRLKGYKNGSAIEAEFDSPVGLVVGPDENIYVCDLGNNRIRLITKKGEVLNFAGSGPAGYKDGEANIAEFNGPADIAFDNDGNLYVADHRNHVIRKITIE